MTDPVLVPRNEDEQNASCLVEPAFAIVTVSADIAGEVDEAWSIIGDFQGAERFLGVPRGAGEGGQGVGSIRPVGTDILEAVVGISRHSYTYAQIRGPMARYAYHGSVALEPAGPQCCKLIYTLTFDRSSMDDEGCARISDRLSMRFGGMVQAMKAAVESPGLS